ncbi:energy transducer TonB [uncultured Bacteroides sp.]|uniref:energy transducer TonB n=1 Tax=uncultured Bacteroides sp. TaxID=162156 RepID=UPI0027DC684E|nr:energy transducer TonB [uncultured Bacteroides sp.]
MEAKKSKKAAIENQRGSWLLMGAVVALAFMFVSFEWTQHDVRLAANSLVNDPIFEEVLVPITYPEEKLEPPPPPEIKVTEEFTIVSDDEEVTSAVATVSEDLGQINKVVWVPPVVETEKVEEDVIHVTAEIMPEFPGGMAALMKYLGANIKYPTISQEMGSMGRVIVQFVVDKDGTITNPTVARGVDAYLDKEAIRVISSMPKWKPGVQNGKKVRVKYTVPVVFRLQ